MTAIKQQAVPKLNLLRRYLRVAIPAFILIVVGVLAVNIWQARQRALFEMGQLTSLWAEATTDSLLPPIANYELFVLQNPDLVIARNSGYPSADSWQLPSATTQNSQAPLGASFSVGNWLTGELFHVVEEPSRTLVARLPARIAVRNAVVSALMPLIGLATLFGIGGGIIETADRNRHKHLRRLIEESTTVTQGIIDTSLTPSKQSDLNELTLAFEQMRQALTQRIDESAELQRTTQQVTNSLDIESGLGIILNTIESATEALGARAIIFNPDGGRPLQYGSTGAVRQGSLDRRLLLLIKNTGREIILRDPSQIRRRLELPDDRELPVEAILAFPLYAQEQLHGILWLGYSRPLATEPTGIDIIRAYVSQAATLVANVKFRVRSERQYRRLAAVLASVLDAVAVTDQTDHFVLINPAMARAFDLDAEGVIGRKVRDIIDDPALLRTLTAPISDVSGREVIRGERVYHSSVANVTALDGSMGRVAVFHDITQLKQLDELKSQFVQNVTHDLRNPLTYIHSYAMLLPEVGTLNEKQQEYVDYIVSGAQRMHNTIGTVLELIRIESATASFYLEPINAAQLLDAISAEFNPAAQTQGNHIIVSAKPNIIVMAERLSLQSALNNLVANALKYAPHTGDILLKVEEDPKQVIFSVRDDGEGIDKADQLRLFEKYYRAAKPHALQKEGSGLGLSIVRSVAERHGGRAWVESEVGHGSTFFLSIPKIVADTPNGQATTAPYLTKSR